MEYYGDGALALLFYFQIAMSGWANSYSYRCQPVDYSDNPLAIRVSCVHDIILQDSFHIAFARVLLFSISALLLLVILLDTQTHTHNQLFPCLSLSRSHLLLSNQQTFPCRLFIQVLFFFTISFRYFFQYFFL